MSRVWLITGAGRGLGRAFAAAALDAGDRVVGTIRRSGALDDLVAAHPGRVAALLLDVADRVAVRSTVEEAMRAFGRLDVVVNNAGHGLVGAIEEVDEAQARAQIDVNLFGPMWVCQAVAPHLRRQGSGHIVQISTVGAVGTVPTLGLYNASKWGLEGFSEALAAELRPFGVRVTIAQLGGFATDWAWSSMRYAQTLPEYDDLRTAVFGSPAVPWDPSGQGSDADTDADPREAAAALLSHVASDDGRLRVLIGRDAPTHVAMALAARRDDYRRDPRFDWPT